MTSSNAAPALWLTSAYLGPVHYYALLYHAARAGVPVIEEQADHYVKQTYRTRCIIAGDDGPIALTLPVSAPPAPVTGDSAPSLSKTPMHRVVVSEHGDWRHRHWQAIVSAYRSSPFFDYYADDFGAAFHRRDLRLVDYNAALRDFVLAALDLHPDLSVNTGRYLAVEESAAAAMPGAFPPDSILDYRETLRPKVPFGFDPHYHPVTYWQVFASRHGFLPNLSILDLLFNMGPEARLVLRDSWGR